MDASLVVSGSESLSILTVTKTGNGVLMSAQGENFFAGSGVPNFDSLVLAGCCHPVSDRTEDQLDNRLRMALKSQQLGTVLNAPDLYFVILMN